MPMAGGVLSDVFQVREGGREGRKEGGREGTGRMESRF